MHNDVCALNCDRTIKNQNTPCVMTHTHLTVTELVGTKHVTRNDAYALNCDRTSKNQNTSCVMTHTHLTVTELVGTKHVMRNDAYALNCDRTSRNQNTLCVMTHVHSLGMCYDIGLTGMSNDTRFRSTHSTLTLSQTRQVCSTSLLKIL